METIRIVCGHDCPDMCSLLAHVENGRVLRIEGDGATYQSTWLDVAAHQEAA